MRLFTQDALFFQSFAERACRFSQFQTDEQAASALLLILRVIYLIKFSFEILTEFT